MDVNIKVTKDNTDKIIQETQERLIVALEKVGLKAEGDVKTTIASYSPKPIVKTGRLMGSITHEVNPSEKEVYIGTNVEYAPYIEYGTSKMAPRPFLKETISENKEEYMEIIKETLENG